MSLKFLLLLLLFVLAPVAVKCHALPDRTAIKSEVVNRFTSISGYVKDSANNNSINGAMITVYENNSLVRSGYTNAAGFFNFTVILGIYSITASKSGFLSNTTTVSVAPYSPANVVIYLYPVGSNATSFLIVIIIVPVVVIVLLYVYISKTKNKNKANSNVKSIKNQKRICPICGEEYEGSLKNHISDSHKRR